LHRISGIIIAFGALLIAWWFWSIMSGSSSYEVAFSFFNSVFGRLLMILWSLCTFYHLCNGIRHLVWDAGFALEIEQAYLAGKVVIIAALLLTMVAWAL
jgi:succinate dehydrogenase / fumarate reductase cytochrome b subunit